MGVCNCSMFCCTLLYVHSSIAIILMGKRELVDLLNLSSWCLVMVERLFLAVQWGCMWLVIVVFPDHTHLLFLKLGKSICCSWHAVAEVCKCSLIKIPMNTTVMHLRLPTIYSSFDMELDYQVVSWSVTRTLWVVQETKQLQTP